jgi:hypothetical protein
MKKSLLFRGLIILGITLSSLPCLAQDTTFNFPYETRFIGFDANGLLSQVMPFNTVIPRSNAPSVISRRMWGNRGVRTGFGAVYDFENEELAAMNWTFGYTSKKQIQGKFYWLRGIDVKFIFTNQPSSFFSNQGFFGVSPYWGVEYQLNQVVSFSTETNLDLGFDFDAFGVIQMIPPLHIQCHFNLSKY